MDMKEMKLVYPEVTKDLPYNKLDNLVFRGDNPRQLFIFPDISKSFPDVSPKSYYVTSGEAIAKTDKCIQDLEILLKNMKEFKKVLLKTRGGATYLELTKCEDGVYSGNVVARKDPKKKKAEESE